VTGNFTGQQTRSGYVNSRSPERGKVGCCQAVSSSITNERNVVPMVMARAMAGVARMIMIRPLAIQIFLTMPFLRR